MSLFALCLHFSNFCLRSEADFSNTEAKLSRAHPFFTRAKSDAVWTGGLGMGYPNLSMVVFYSHL